MFGHPGEEAAERTLVELEALRPKGSQMDGKARLFSAEHSKRARATSTSRMRGNADWRSGGMFFPLHSFSTAMLPPPSMWVFTRWLDEALS